MVRDVIIYYTTVAWKQKNWDSLDILVYLSIYLEYPPFPYMTEVSVFVLLYNS